MQRQQKRQHTKLEKRRRSAVEVGGSKAHAGRSPPISLYSVLSIEVKVRVFRKQTARLGIVESVSIFVRSFCCSIRGSSKFWSLATSIVRDVTVGVVELRAGREQRVRVRGGAQKQSRGSLRYVVPLLWVVVVA